MQQSEIQAHVHFRHNDAREVAELDQAAIPMTEYIASVSTHQQRWHMRTILSGQYFRAYQATEMVAMLLRAAKYAKLHLSDYFPLMRAQILDDALVLEQAALEYKDRFEALKRQATLTL
jgi:hypothetical protein